MYSESFQAQLQHLCDIVLCVQSLADNSDIYRLLPDPTRYGVVVRQQPTLLHCDASTLSWKQKGAENRWCSRIRLVLLLLPPWLSAACVAVRSAAALLEVRRVPELGLLRQRYSEDRLYVIRMKRRSISVGVLDLVPLEAASEQGGADGSSKSDKPTVAQICGTGPGKSKLDF